MHTQDWAEACGLDTPEHSTSLAVLKGHLLSRVCQVVWRCWPAGLSGDSLMSFRVAHP